MLFSLPVVMGVYWIECCAARVDDIIARVESSFKRSLKQIAPSRTNFNLHTSFIHENIDKICVLSHSISLL